MSAERAKEKTQEIVISSNDILFECPSCGKSLVVDEGAEGAIIGCPQCQTSVIVPPKQGKSTLAPPPRTTQTHPAQEETAGAAKMQGADLPPQKRLAVLAGQLKEIQAQRTEISNRIASRLNEVNRDLVLLARLETSQQQILSEWNQLVEKITNGQSPPATDSDSPTPVVVGSSVSAAGRTRVSFRQ
jgi:uncharacterized Zn finger protein (UPF0148 family)